MNRKITLILVFLMFEFSPALFAQEGDNTGGQEGPRLFDWLETGEFRPFMEASYGYGEPKYKDLNGDFSQIGSADFKLGYSETKKFKKAYIKSLNERYVFASYLATELDRSGGGTGNVATEMWRFGLGSRSGFGYSVLFIDLLPYNQNAFALTKLKSDSFQADVASVDSMAIFEGTFKFGQLTEGGIKVRSFRLLSLTGSYELATVFPEFDFWPWLGSFSIQYLARAAVSAFAEHIVSFSPILGPVIYFLLKNGLSFGFYTVMKDEMYWPFNSDPPLTVETIKVGVAITF